MNEERMRILKMIQEGQLSAEEGARLLEALERPTTERTRPTSEWELPGGAKSIRIRVFDQSTGQEKVNFGVPIVLAKMFGSFIPESQRDHLESHGIRIDDLLRAVETGKVGSVVDINNTERNERIEISIE